MSSFAPFLLCALACLFLSVVLTTRTKPRPPGPRLGWFASVKLPRAYQWLTYAKWRHIYGDIIYLRIFGNPIMVINSQEVAEDLLERRSRNYSSRPVRTMVVDLMGWDWLFSSMPYGPRWRDHRSLFHRHFRRHMTSNYHPVVLKETHTTLRNLLDSPELYAHHIRRYSCFRMAAAVVMKISYGHEISDKGDVYVTIADEAMQGLGKAGIFGTFLVDYLPLLKYVPEFMPGAGFKRQARVWRAMSRKMIEKPFQMVKERMENGTASSCFAQKELETWMQSSERDPEYETLIKNVAGISYAAGADTTVSALLSFILAMVVYPEVQRKIQQQLDDILGMQRLPTLADRGKLPFIDCVVSECLRWNPVLPLGLVHLVSEDDEYGGYFIPKGTSILPNVWAMLHDETCYPNPMEFDPDRFVDQHRNMNLGINKFPQAAFGFGRRLCPGRWLAMDSVWIAVASILTVYTIEKALSEDGVEISPSIDYTSSFLSRPKPFQCRFVPRSERAIDLIKQTGVNPSASDHPDQSLE
ncbi:cytochrome P450 [Imleria badia]|nr:cytochrome P450 [Imleria badia]